MYTYLSVAGWLEFTEGYKKIALCISRKMKIVVVNVDLVHGEHNPVESGGEQRTEEMRDTCEEICVWKCFCFVWKNMNTCMNPED